MMERTLGVFAAAALLLACAGKASAGNFGFYGLRFGMTQAEVQAVFPGQRGAMIVDPGHGMSSLELGFDREGLLMEIRAGYLRPEGTLENTGIKRALREKFVAPVNENHPGVDVTIDEFSNRAAYTVIFQSSGIREKNIEHYKQEYLRAME